MSSGSPSQTVQLVGGPARRSPSSRQTGWPSELALQVVERGVERRARRELARREPLDHLLERERVVAQELRVLLDVRQRGLGRLAVAVDRARLAEARDAGVPELDDDDVLACRARCAR